MSSSSEELSGSSRDRRDPFLEKLRRLEEEYRRYRPRDGRSRSRRRSRKDDVSDYDKENGERIAGKYRRTSHFSRRGSFSRNQRRSSSCNSDEKSGERYLRETSHSSRRSVEKTHESQIADKRVDREDDEKDPSSPSLHADKLVKQTESQEQANPVLGETTLGLLGVDPSKYEKPGPDIHLAVAERWSKILQNGLPKDQKQELQLKYPTIGNCPSTKAPKLNPEIKPALSHLAIRKDSYQYVAQNQLGAGINAIGAALTEVLKAENSMEHEVHSAKFIERLADAGRIFSDLHYDMSKTRKSFIIPGCSVIGYM